MTREEIIRTKNFYKILKKIQIFSDSKKNYFKNHGITFEIFFFFFNNFSNLEKKKVFLIFQQLNKDKTGYLKFKEFHKLFFLLKKKNFSNKFKLFTKIADKDNNGLLSYEEIFDLAKICINDNFMYSTLGFEKNEFLIDITHYFSKLIFCVCKIKEDFEIPILNIKDIILNKEKGYKILKFFCGLD